MRDRRHFRIAERPVAVVYHLLQFFTRNFTIRIKRKNFQHQLLIAELLPLLQLSPETTGI